MTELLPIPYANEDMEKVRKLANKKFIEWVHTPTKG
jgi:hypothetical protein